MTGRIRRVNNSNCLSCSETDGAAAQRAEASVGEVLSEDAVSKLTVVGTEVCEEEGPVPSLYIHTAFSDVGTTGDRVRTGEPEEPL